MSTETHECVFAEEQEPTGRLVLAPCLVCGFTALDALDQLRVTLSDTKRVLYHVVHTYDEWRGTSLGVPNEFTDDSIRVGREHLQEIGWWPDMENKREKVPVCPTCQREMFTEIGSWSGERLWRCELHGVFYPRDFQ